MKGGNKMSKSIIQIKGLDKLEKKLSNISKNLKRYTINFALKIHIHNIVVGIILIL